MAPPDPGLRDALQRAAEALDLAHEVGSLDAGCMADLCLWEWAVGPAGGRRIALALQHGQAHQGLDAAHEGAARGQGVLVVQLLLLFLLFFRV